MRYLLLLLLCLPTLVSAGEGKEFGGVGLQVVPTAVGELVVLQVVASSPAASGGLQSGDLIVQVDDFRRQGSEFSRVISEHLWGPVGTPVRLRYMRPGVAGTYQMVLQRTALDPRITVTPAVSAPAPTQGKSQ